MSFKFIYVPMLVFVYLFAYPFFPKDYDWRKHHSNSSSLASSLEAKMLASLKREQLEEMYEEDKGPEANSSFELHNYGDDDLSSSSDDTTTTFSTWKPPVSFHQLWKSIFYKKKYKKNF